MDGVPPHLRQLCYRRLQAAAMRSPAMPGAADPVVGAVVLEVGGAADLTCRSTAMVLFTDCTVLPAPHPHLRRLPTVATTVIVPLPPPCSMSCWSAAAALCCTLCWRCSCCRHSKPRSNPNLNPRHACSWGKRSASGSGCWRCRRAWRACMNDVWGRALAAWTSGRCSW